MKVVNMETIMVSSARPLVLSSFLLFIQGREL